MSRRSFASYHATNNVSPFFFDGLRPFSCRIVELLELTDNSSPLAKQHGITWLWPGCGALKVHSHILGTSFLLKMSPSTRDSHVGHLYDQYLEELTTSEERHFLFKAKETYPVGLTVN